MTLSGRHFLGVEDCSCQEWLDLLQLAGALKRGETRLPTPGSVKVLGLLFSKPSTRTRVSFAVAMARLGGQTMDLPPDSTQVGRGESIADTARVLSSYVDALAIRTFAQNDLEAYAQASTVPVINALSDAEHPCQVIADFLTLQECFPDLNGLTMAYVGDGNNVAHSLLLAAALLGVHLRVATPRRYEPDPAVVQRAQRLSRGRCTVTVLHDPVEACRGAQAVYTDVWSSMGQEAAAQQRRRDFSGYCLNAGLLAHAAPDAVVLHCLPAHRGEEISNEVLEGSASRVFLQAENRLYGQQALLALLLDLV